MRLVGLHGKHVMINHIRVYLSCHVILSDLKNFNQFTSILVHEPGGLLVSFWVAISPINFLKAQKFYCMKKSGGHANKVA